MDSVQVRDLFGMTNGDQRKDLTCVWHVESGHSESVVITQLSSF